MKYNVSTILLQPKVSEKSKWGGTSVQKIRLLWLGFCLLGFVFFCFFVLGFLNCYSFLVFPSI